MDARTSSRQRKLSRQQEKHMAEDLGGRPTPGSGSRAHSKGDVRVQGQVRGEAKFTGKDRYVLKLSVLEKIQKEALEGGLESPVLQLGFMRLGKIEAKFAIWPLQPPESFNILECGDTYAKSLILVRSVMEKFLSGLQNKVFICFQFVDGTRSPKYYAIAHWRDYLEWRSQYA